MATFFDEPSFANSSRNSLLAPGFVDPKLVVRPAQKAIVVARVLTDVLRCEYSHGEEPQDDSGGQVQRPIFSGPAAAAAAATVDSIRLLELRARVVALIGDIDLALKEMRSRSIERRSAAPAAPDDRPPPGTPIEYSGGGYVLKMR